MSQHFSSSSIVSHHIDPSPQSSGILKNHPLSASLSIFLLSQYLPSSPRRSSSSPILSRSSPSSPLISHDAPSYPILSPHYPAPPILSPHLPSSPLISPPRPSSHPRAIRSSSMTLLRPLSPPLPFPLLALPPPSIVLSYYLSRSSSHQFIISSSPSYHPDLLSSSHRVSLSFYHHLILSSSQSSHSRINSYSGPISLSSYHRLIRSSCHRPHSSHQLILNTTSYLTLLHLPFSYLILSLVGQARPRTQSHLCSPCVKSGAQPLPHPSWNHAPHTPNQLLLPSAGPDPAKKTVSSQARRLGV